ncbi:protein of unknown function DUF4419 [Klosneuvirus KNV1]|uniref:Uncharacterized protein n=1 Tax=Klosneuvirus KNV1 TaxID=1977640 RepID=A0A1V0SJY5_9VIRU|nr:protein of unknown function DUF4419 [Klosneuvirus KNV1]
MAVVHIIDSAQLPDATKFTSFDQFSSRLLKSSADFYPKERDYITHLKNESRLGVKIDSDFKLEAFTRPIPKNKTTYHDGYMHYLLTAWKADCGIEVAPWHIWNVILHQFCQIVKDQSDKYRHLFTTSSEKTRLVFSDDPESANYFPGTQFDIKIFFDTLQKHIKMDINKFIPQFSGQPDGYAESMMGLFADMVQEYYSCMILGCSIPKVRVRGTSQEWNRLLTTITELEAITGCEYFTNIKQPLSELINNLKNKDYWSKFFYLDRCGSGHQEELAGHIKKFLFNKGKILSNELPNMISRYPFKHLPSGSGREDHNFISGIMYSNLDSENILVPEYHYNITQFDTNLCKFTPQSASQNMLLVDFLELANKYHCTYGKDYRKNHMVITESRNKLADGIKKIYLEYADFRKTLDNFTIRYNQKDNEKYLHELHEKHMREIAKHNQIVRECQQTGKPYLQVLNEQRKMKLKTQYYFWLKDQEDIDRNANTYELVRNVPLERFIELLKLQEEDVNFIQEHLDPIYEYIKNNRFDVYTERVITMHNPVVLKLFLDKFKSDPFKFHWPRGGSSGDNTLCGEKTHDDLYGFFLFANFDEYLTYQSMHPNVLAYVAKQLFDLLSSEDKRLLLEMYIKNYKLSILNIVNEYNKSSEQIETLNKNEDHNSYRWRVQNCGYPYNKLSKLEKETENEQKRLLKVYNLYGIDMSEKPSYKPSQLLNTTISSNPPRTLNKQMVQQNFQTVYANSIKQAIIKAGVSGDDAVKLQNCLEQFVNKVYNADEVMKDKWDHWLHRNNDFVTKCAESAGKLNYNVDEIIKTIIPVKK